jgi:hypothetical protein
VIIHLAELWLVKGDKRGNDASIVGQRTACVVLASVDTITCLISARILTTLHMPHRISEWRSKTSLK